jgi:hypothetical protein
MIPIPPLAGPRALESLGPGDKPFFKELKCYKESSFWSAEEKKQDGARFFRNDETAIIEAKHGNGNGKKCEDQGDQQVFGQAAFYRMDHTMSLPLGIFASPIVDLF